MTEHAVVVAGGGPTGMMLAAELVLAGVKVLVVERRPTAALVGSRAGGLHARTIEVFDQRGIGDRFVSAGTTHPQAQLGGAALDLSDFPSRRPYVLALWQNHIERILSEWMEQLHVPILRGHDVVSFSQRENGVDVELTGGQRLHARYLVGCDGGRSAVRKLAGIDFAGSPPTISHLLAEVRLTGEPPWGFKHDVHGTHAISKHDAPGFVRVMITEENVGAIGEPTLEELSLALIRVYGTDFGVHSPIWITRFTDASRQATTYRAGRVLLAGDAAHIHYPAGGQGLNLGVQDAVNLGWKLARVVKGTSPETLLDTYEAERHPIAARVLRLTMAQVALRVPGERHQALGELTKELLSMEQPRKRFAGLISGLDLRYDPDDEGAHPLVGRRMPDLDLRTQDGLRTVYSFLHHAHPLLLNLTSVHHFLDVRGGVTVVQAHHEGAWTLPVIGEVAAPEAVLVRPDGYVAWAGSPDDPRLKVALERWFPA